MNPMLLQKQLRENASDVQEFCKELKSWGEEMKRQKEGVEECQRPQVKSSLSSKLKKQKTEEQNKHVTFSKDTENSSNPPKTKTTDYLAWDKFDADAECEKVDYDENDDSELTDEQDESKRDEAFVEKEKGNKFVKEKKWDEAIKCYTKAIDCYAYDPIFYANRALCFLKKENMLKAESDCTLSLKIDQTYVKAYQRRAAAREALNKLEEAENDLQNVLQLEPNNKESREALEVVRKKLKLNKQPVDESQRPISKFTAIRNQKRATSGITNPPNLTQSQIVDATKPQSHWPSGDDVILVRNVNKPPHMRSKAPLKRLEIKEIHEDSLSSQIGPSSVIECEAVKSHVVEKKEEHVPKFTPLLKTDDLKIIEKIETEHDISTKSKELKNDFNQLKTIKNQIEKTGLVPPRNSVQFYTIWRQLKSKEEKYEYLKLLKAEKIPDVFKENLDSNVFVEILSIISEYFILNGDKIFPFLWHFSKVKRFSTFTMFMSSNDKNYLRKMIDHIKEQEGRTSEEMENLIELYEL